MSDWIGVKEAGFDEPFWLKSVRANTARATRPGLEITIVVPLEIARDRGLLATTFGGKLVVAERGFDVGLLLAEVAQDAAYDTRFAPREVLAGE